MGNELPGPMKPRPLSERMYLVIEYITPIGIVAHVGFIPLFYWLGVPAMAWFNVASVAAWFVARRASQEDAHHLAVALITVEVVAHAVLAVYYVGWESGFAYYLVPLIPFLLFDDLISARVTVPAATAAAVTFLVLRAFLREPVVLEGYDRLQLLGYINVAIPFLALGVISYVFRFSSHDAEKRMEHLATTDALTQLPNRRRMWEALRMESARFRRNERPFSVLIVDIDHFKRFNDEQGHAAGDRALQEVSALLRGSLREQDVVARWGGEEFLILLPETDRGGAKHVAEKLRAKVAQHDFGAGSSRSITITTGVATFCIADTPDECIGRADAALYEGKRLGRNRVEIEDDDALPSSPPPSPTPPDA